MRTSFRFEVVACFTVPLVYRSPIDLINRTLLPTVGGKDFLQPFPSADFVSKRSSMSATKLGIGDYEWRAGFVPSKEQAHNLFLDAVKKVVPKVLDDLKDGPFVIFRQLHCPETPGTAWPAPDTLLKSLSEWQSKWNLKEHWCQERAMQTMDYWCSNLAAAGQEWKPDTGGLRSPAVTDAERRFTFEVDGWDPTTERRRDVRERILLAFQQHLDEYLTKIEQLVLTRSMIDTSAVANITKQSTLRQAPTKRELEHFEWLALFQVQGWTYPAIAKQYNRARKAVEDGVKNTAAMIDLALRPAIKTGRPRGIKETKSRLLRG